MKKIEDWVYKHLATEWCGGEHPPGDHETTYFKDPSWPEVACWLNDGSELWLGTKHDWHTHMIRKNARQLAFFIIWSDVKIWFGLRRKIWYWALHKKVNRFKENYNAS